MTKFKADLSKVSINQLQQLTGSSYRTIKKRLEGTAPIEHDGNTLFFDPKVALPLIFESDKLRGPGGDDVSEILDPQVQNARLAQARTKKTNIEIEVLMGNLIPAEKVEKAWTDLILSFRSKVLALPTRLSPIIATIRDPGEIQIKLDETLREALNELSNFRAEPHNADSDDESDEEVSAAVETEGL